MLRNTTHRRGGGAPPLGTNVPVAAWHDVRYTAGIAPGTARDRGDVSDRSEEKAMLTFTVRRSRLLVPSLCFGVAFASASGASAQGKPTAAADSHLVAPAALARFLPAPDGWLKGDVKPNQVDDASGCNYTVATVLYTKDAVRVRITIADTGGHAESLMAVASMIATLPDDFDGKVPPATILKRMKIDGSPASEMWDSEKMTGEITVLLGGRFVVAVDAQKADGPELLRTMLALVDVKALASLK